MKIGLLLQSVGSGGFGVSKIIETLRLIYEDN